MNCKAFQSSMPDLLLDPQSLSGVAARAHAEGCPACKMELVSFRSTLDLLNDWQAPKPSAYFDQKLAVRLREEQANAPAGWLERLRTHLLFNTGRQFRPALAGAFAFALLVSGGTFASLSSFPGHPAVAPMSAAVGDLQILDKNDQALQQMDQLLQEDQSTDDYSTAPPTT